MDLNSKAVLGTRRSASSISTLLLYLSLVVIMSALPAAALRRAAGSQLRQRVAIRAYASVAPTTPSASSSGPSLFLNGPPSAKVQSEAKLVKFGGKGAPITPGVRHTVQLRHPHLHSGGPLRELTVPLRRKGGRNHTGQVVNRHTGGGHKRRLRIVDFHRSDAGEHDVVRIEYDPGRSAHIALIRRRTDADAVDTEEGARLAELTLDDAKSMSSATWSTDKDRRELRKVRGGWSYILAPDGLRAGDVVRSYRSGVPDNLVEGLSTESVAIDTDPASPQTVDSPTAATSSASSSRALGLLRTLTLKPGNVLPLRLCPPGTIIHNISLSPSGKMQLCRSAGTFGQIVAHGSGKVENDIPIEEQGQLQKLGWTLVKLQSGEVRKLHPECVATVGTVSK